MADGSARGLTWAEIDERRAVVPALAPTRGEPLRAGEPTRLALEWDGPAFAEIEPSSGSVVAVGNVEHGAST
jgi:hypothetical protein